MTLRWIFAALHLLALGIGLGAIWTRSRALKGPLDAAGLQRVFTADNWWGLAAGIWIGTGLVRVFSPLEKGSAYYFHNAFFMAKMTAFALILILEVRPMITLIRWRAMVRHGQTPDTSAAATFARTSAIQAFLVVVMVLTATAMARDLGVRLAAAIDPPVLQQSHAWIVVSPGAPERKVLEEAGFRISPILSRHDGQGTASISVEFLNGYLELLYPDSTVSVSPALQAGAEKFRLKSRWRETGYSPIGIVLDRTPATPDSFPFPTWRISADWMDPGTFIEMLTPKGTPKALSLSISSHRRSAQEENAALSKDPKMKDMFLHPNGARRVTAFRVVAPSPEALPPATAYVQQQGIMTFTVGDQWVLDMTLDAGAQGKTKDLRPTLPLVIHY